MHFYKKGLVIAASLLLFACGLADDDDHDHDDDDHGFEIHHFMAAPSGATAMPAPPITVSAANSKDFDVMWTVHGHDPYTVKVFLSDNPTKSDDDSLIHSATCGSDSAAYSCDENGMVMCMFMTTGGASNRISCASATAVDISAQVAHIHDTVNLNLVFEACNEAGDDCLTETVPFNLAP